MRKLYSLCAALGVAIAMSLCLAADTSPASGVAVGKTAVHAAEL
jgi:hypothetical protein